MNSFSGEVLVQHERTQILCACVKTCLHTLSSCSLNVIHSLPLPPHLTYKQRSEARRKEKLQQQQQETSTTEDGYVMDGAPHPAPYVVCQQNYMYNWILYTSCSV